MCIRDSVGSEMCIRDRFIYGVENLANGNFFKIQISDWSLADTNSWVGSRNGHGGKIDTVSGVIHFTGQIGWYAKVQMSDLSYEEMDLRDILTLATDDVAFSSIDLGVTGYNTLFVGGEFRNSETGKGLAVIDTDAMTKFSVGILPTVGLFLSDDLSTLYNASKAGFIEQIDLTSFIVNAPYNQRFDRNTYTFTGVGFPNEIIFDGSDIYMTNFEEVAHLFKVELIPYKLPLVTEAEAYYRGLDNKYNLQTVTDGPGNNQTTNDIISSVQITAVEFFGVESKGSALTPVDGILVGTNNGFFLLKIKSDDITGEVVLQSPKVSGTIPVSVSLNGGTPIFADINGNMDLTIPTGGTTPFNLKIKYEDIDITVPNGFTGIVTNLNDIYVDVSFTVLGTNLTVTSGAGNGDMLLINGQS
jgi:hypothetical protein